VYPGLLEDVMPDLSQFGEIACIDITEASASGRLLVTFWDARSAEKLVSDWKGHAEICSPTINDFHAVSFKASLLEESHLNRIDLESFGEIAGISRYGDEMVLQFYDMRAAQKIVMNVPGCRAWRPHSATADTRNVAFASAAPAAAALAYPASRQNLTKSTACNQLGLDVAAVAAAAIASDQGALTRMFRAVGANQDSNLPMPTSLAGGFAQARNPYHQSACTSPAPVNAPAKGHHVGVVNAAMGSATSAGVEEHVWDEVNSEGHARFDFVPDWCAERPQCAAVGLDDVGAAAGDPEASARMFRAVGAQGVDESTDSLHRAIARTVNAAARAAIAAGIVAGVEQAASAGDLRAQGYRCTLDSDLPPPTSLAGGFAPAQAVHHRAACTSARPLLVAPPGRIELSAEDDSARPGRIYLSAEDEVDSASTSEDDASMFRFVPEKVVSGEDRRTTVEISNITRQCTSSRFRMFLAEIGLRYTFMYMPSRKKSGTLGRVAFLNFRAPEDLLTLHAGLRGCYLWKYSGWTPALLRYARPEDEEALINRFAPSAMMCGSDSQHRPTFIFGNGRD